MIDFPLYLIGVCIFIGPLEPFSFDQVSLFVILILLKKHCGIQQLSKCVSDFTMG